MSRNEDAALKGVVAEKRARSDAAGTIMAELKNHRDKASVSNTTCCKERLQVQISFATAFEKVKDSPARTIAMTKEQNTVTTEYEELCSSVEERVGFANREMACLEEEVTKVTQK